MEIELWEDNVKSETQSRMIRFIDEISKDVGKTSYYCDICKKSFTLKRQNAKPHHCDICGKSFSQKSNLTTHLYIHTGHNPRPHCCDICGKSFSQKSNLTTHKYTHTGGKPKPYHCDICGKSFSKKKFGNSLHVFDEHKCKE
ncbi:zinc finger protein 765-like [Octopus sinensis]|uniref:Zinc finger protein 765-like n=1 Tax=Octopus sinensis TaxID=2607531 RepID=A0A6P7TXW9_9MOLL|nr:zinc finger protein 765-like [Octopus sinensis]